ncbi:hypothetical protein E2F46_08680 [Luteimonas aestuarii]|uniref:Uncharacterized protein n=1 Tax=Luteimonas aestuarii TaxID=453837 RepID=A0A4R5TTL9_9GAMM|nr:hypothetical protein [Luteimonas aestuarii]TDK24351.1 hypothetical protein E2F46_08680 [Luteimonas aestuarii]
MRMPRAKPLSPTRARLAAGGWWVAIALSMLLPAFAQETVEGDASPRTGDAWVDTQLPDIDRYAARHPDAFVDELVRYQGAPRLVVEEALQAGMPAGHLYYACALAQAAGRSCRNALDAWPPAGDEGWAAVAEVLAPDRPGEAQQRVKRGIVESYTRWARPITLDASLRRAFPDHASSGR